MAQQRILDVNGNELDQHPKLKGNGRTDFDRLLSSNLWENEWRERTSTLLSLGPSKILNIRRFINHFFGLILGLDIRGSRVRLSVNMVYEEQSLKDWKIYFNLGDWTVIVTNIRVTNISRYQVKLTSFLQKTSVRLSLKEKCSERNFLVKKIREIPTFKTPGCPGKDGSEWDNGDRDLPFVFIYTSQEDTGHCTHSSCGNNSDVTLDTGTLSYLDV